MLRIAIVEQEAFSKDVIFYLQKILNDEFSFVYFEKISKLVREEDRSRFDIIILNEAYNNVRVSDALDLNKTNSVIIYCSEEEEKTGYAPYARIFTIKKSAYQEDLLTIKDFLEERLANHKEYLFSYNGVSLKLKYHDIYYIEKEDKNLVYHTKKGLLYERCSIASKAEEFLPFDFIRIHSGIIVNYEYIYSVGNDELELQDHTILPISRSRKQYVADYMREKVKG